MAPTSASFRLVHYSTRHLDEHVMFISFSLSASCVLQVYCILLGYVCHSLWRVHSLLMRVFYLDKLTPSP